MRTAPLPPLDHSTQSSQHITGAPATSNDDQTHASLALLLHQTLLDRDSWKEKAELYKDRAERAEGLLRRLGDSDEHAIESGNSGPASPIDVKPGQTVAVLLQTQAQLDATKGQLVKSEAKFRSVSDAWDNYDKWQLDCERRVASVRQSVGLQITQLHDSSFDGFPLELAAHPPTFPPTAVRHRANVSHIPLEFPSLPAPPALLQSPSRVRARAGSLESDRDGRSKRPKSDRMRVSEEPHSAYPARGSAASESSSYRFSQVQSPGSSSVQLPGISVPRGRSHHASSPNVSNMLPPMQQRVHYANTSSVLQNSTAEHQFHPQQPKLMSREDGLPAGPFLNNPNYELQHPDEAHKKIIGAHRRSKRDRVSSDFGGDSDNEKSIDEMLMELSSSHPPPNATSSTPHGRGAIPGVKGYATLEGHVFAPPFVGQAPKKSTKTTDGGREKGAEGQGLASSSTSPPTMHPATNALGQRTCRQCGQPGRYKDGKCIEKWGPGPLGPGTVCDRCRKKMKRVERRGQLEAGLLPNPNSTTTSRTYRKVESSPDSHKTSFSSVDVHISSAPRAGKQPALERIEDNEDAKANPSTSVSSSRATHRRTESKSTSNQNSQSDDERRLDADPDLDLDAEAEADEDAEGEKETVIEGIYQPETSDIPATRFEDEMETDR